MSSCLPYRDPSLPVEERIRDLLGRMTREEKILQTMQIVIGRDSNVNNVCREAKFEPQIGSVLSFVGNREQKDAVRERNEYQRIAVETTRLGIPIIWGLDVIHGWHVTYPHGLAQGASFEPDVVQEIARRSARAAYYADGVNWTFAPMVEVGHDPRWGRNVEGFGEDPYLAGRMAAAAVKGFQTEDPSRPGAVAACLKHFVGYSASEGGRDYAYTDISDRALQEWYLPPFEAGVKAGALTVMSSFNDISGIPAVCNRDLLTGILREKWGFDGFVVSDWGAVVQTAHQGFSRDGAIQSAACVKAGNDMDMADLVYAKIGEAIDRGLMQEEDLDRAVANILRVKFKLGLFEHPFVEELSPAEIYRQEDFDFAREAARKCMVLLQNEGGLLPLDPAVKRRIALIGPAAEDEQTHTGSWCAGVFPGVHRADRLCDVIGPFFPGSEIRFTPGCSLLGMDDGSGIPAAVKAAEWADVVILALGEDVSRSGEYCSCTDIGLPARQLELAQAVRTAGKPVVLLVSCGRAMDSFPVLSTCADAILLLWQSGLCAADAALDVVTGACNPSGRLPVTIPRSVAQVPIYYNHHSSARPWYRQYTDMESGPFYPFGYGLSYSHFVYGPLERKGLTVSFLLSNDSDRAGTETVIWYLSDPEASLTQPVKRVIAFEKVFLEARQSRIVTLQLDPMRDLAYVMPSGTRKLEEGEFIIRASDQQSLSFVYPVSGE